MRDFALEVHFSKWEFAARHHLTASDAESMTLPDLLAMAAPEDRSAFEGLWLGYTTTQGAADLRAVIAETYDGLGPDNIQCFAGAEEGIYVAMKVLLSRDDHAVVLVPNYQAAESLPLEICEVTGVALRADEGWRLDLDDVRAAIRPSTKLISVNFPNNPTGAIADAETFAGLIEICRAHDLYLFNDEVYRLLELDAGKRLAQTADLYEKGMSLNVMSKAYGLPGLRIGWIASQDTTALAKFERYKHYLSICNAGPSERLALIALKNRDKILERNRGILRENLAKLDAFFDRYPELFAWRHPDGGCVVYPRFLGAWDVETFCRRLVEEAGVLLLPGSIYRSELLESPPDRFRIGCGRRNMDDGLSALAAFLDRNHNELAP